MKKEMKSSLLKRASAIMLAGVLTFGEMMGGAMPILAKEAKDEMILEESGAAEEILTEGETGEIVEALGSSEVTADEYMETFISDLLDREDLGDKIGDKSILE